MSISPPAPRLRRNTPAGTTPRHFAIVGAGMAGITCARTLAQAGHEVTGFEKSAEAGGRPATIDTPFGSFDAGAQYFTVRDPRFAQAVDMLPGLCRRWSANAVQMLDAAGRVTASGLPRREAHWVASPGMQSLLARWAEPLRQADRLMTGARATPPHPPHPPPRGKLRTEGPDGSRQSHAGFHAVLLAQPPLPAQALLQNAGRSSFLSDALEPVTTAPCWTLMLAYPQAVRPGLTTLGPQWNAARSTHHRIAWLARESSKPGRQVIERWTVQASPVWSAEHLEDDPARVQAKLLQAFAAVTRIPAQPPHPPPGPQPSVGRRPAPGRLRRLVPGAPAGRCFRPGAGTGARRGLTAGVAAGAAQAQPRRRRPLRALRELPPDAPAPQIYFRIDDIQAPDTPEDVMSDTPHQEEAHIGPIKNPRQLLAAVLFSFLIPIFGIIGLVLYVASADQPAAGAANPERAIAERLQKVGAVEIRDANRPLKSGEEVFKTQCMTCHAAGVAGAPKLGDTAAWSERIKTGLDALLHSALKGKGAMAPQGGGDFSDTEIAPAVVHMANTAGAHFEEPAAPAAAASAPPPQSTPPPPQPTPTPP